MPFLTFPSACGPISFGSPHCAALFPCQKASSKTGRGEKSLAESDYEEDDDFESSASSSRKSKPSSTANELYFAVELDYFWNWLGDRRSIKAPVKAVRFGSSAAPIPPIHDQLWHLRSTDRFMFFPNSIVANELKSSIPSHSCYFNTSVMLRGKKQQTRTIVFVGGPIQNNLYYSSESDNFNQVGIFYECKSGIKGLSSNGRGCIAVLTEADYFFLQYDEDSLNFVTAHHPVDPQVIYPISFNFYPSSRPHGRFDECLALSDSNLICTFNFSKAIGDTNPRIWSFSPTEEITKPFKQVIYGYYMRDFVAHDGEKVYLLDARFNFEVKCVKSLFSCKEHDEKRILSICATEYHDLFVICTDQKVFLIEQSTGNIILSWFHFMTEDPSNMFYHKLDDSKGLICLFGQKSRRMCFLTIELKGKMGPFISLGNPRHLPFFPKREAQLFESSLDSLTGVLILNNQSKDDEDVAALTLITVNREGERFFFSPIKLGRSPLEVEVDGNEPFDLASEFKNLFLDEGDPEALATVSNLKPPVFEPIFREILSTPIKGKKKSHEDIQFSNLLQEAVLSFPKFPNRSFLYPEVEDSDNSALIRNSGCLKSLYTNSHLNLLAAVNSRCNNQLLADTLSVIESDLAHELSLANINERIVEHNPVSFRNLSSEDDEIMALIEDFITFGIPLLPFSSRSKQSAERMITHQASSSPKKVKKSKTTKPSIKTPEVASTSAPKKQALISVKEEPMDHDLMMMAEDDEDYYGSMAIPLTQPVTAKERESALSMQQQKSFASSTAAKKKKRKSGF